ncbi:hypothetical protein Pcinc_035246 [Petrolisthes cinctipes]|uniref:Uncharacterized protein n=1 Tax=Petrolisthes cinctipes TaxID=88211 RepID=A0AAE1C088_PETCI|nr:hypothetical protein Pcinc_035246 [Petrolisthes cinctipes]
MRRERQEKIRYGGIEGKDRRRKRNRRGKGGKDRKETNRREKGSREDQKRGGKEKGGKEKGAGLVTRYWLVAAVKVTHQTTLLLQAAVAYPPCLDVLSLSKTHASHLTFLT